MRVPATNFVSWFPRVFEPPLVAGFFGAGSGFVVVDGAGYAAGGPVVGQFKIGALATVESGHFGIRNDIAAVHPHF